MSSQRKDNKNIIKVAFFKGKGSLLDKIIRWVTKSKYSHIEILIGDIWYASYAEDGGVRAKENAHRGLKEDWDYITLPQHYEERILEAYKACKGDTYSYINLLFKYTSFKPFKKSLDCAEFASLCLFSIAHKNITPQDIFIELHYKRGYEIDG